MASRRIRIKGIANIPQRRKPSVAESEGSKDNSSKAESKIEEITDNLTFANVSETTNSKLAIQGNNVSDVAPSTKENKADNSQVEVTENLAADVKTSLNSSEIVKAPLPQQAPAVVRRKYIKPPVSLNVINRKSKLNGENESNAVNELADTQKKPSSDKVIILNDQIVKPICTEEVRSASPQKPHVLDLQDIIYKETHFTPNEPNSKCEIIPIDRSIKRLPHNVQIVHHSDTEYPPPPPSPSKINRSRIKAVPRLSQRKTSFSASESEDETKRQYNRHRNDSMCSTTSVAADTSSVSECMSPQRHGREFNSVIREKCKKKVHSRKLAEARRQFNLKYFGKLPDRQKLTMIDLIFYNPTTNPMKNEDKPKKDEEEKVDEPEAAEEETPDDPCDDKSDDDNEMPVPQLKVGPQGEIVLDEKSLVVESKGTKRGREELQRSRVIDGDFDTGYGIYKRAKRSKDWTATETLRFYKALNTIGTDFFLMCDLFPKRTRRELKLKFKKEEKINKTLIDKALMNPCEFEYNELKDEVDMEERELELLEEQKATEAKAKKEKSSLLIKKHRAPKIADDGAAKQKVEPPKKQNKAKKKRGFDIMSILEDSDADESDVESESEADFEIINPPKPTRYGRVPKVQKDDLDVPRTRRGEEQPAPEDLEPGSLMFIPTGPNEFKIFMVTPDGKKTPLNLNNDVISKVMDYKQGAESIMTISAERRSSVPAIEYNVTIPAGEEKNNNEGAPEAVEEPINLVVSASLREEKAKDDSVQMEVEKL